MDSFVWTENFLTGLPDVDRQHQHLVAIINRFGSLLANNEIAFSDVDDLFRELTDYTQYHFTEEEKLMTEAGVDVRHSTRHMDRHSGFLQEVTDLYAGVSPDNLDSARHMLEFLIHWLVYHILGEDQNMARQIADPF